MPPSPSSDSIRYRGPKSVPGCSVKENTPENWTAVLTCDWSAGGGVMTPEATVGSVGLRDAAGASELSNPNVSSRSGDDRVRPHREHEAVPDGCASSQWGHTRSEEHTSELQSQSK